jgi:hypothetical protein
MVAEVEVMPVTVTALITGVDAAAVTNVAFGEVADVPAAFAETTSKL